jgi:RNA polymerase sigma factor (sigma-70 family)
MKSNKAAVAIENVDALHGASPRASVSHLADRDNASGSQDSVDVRLVRECLAGDQQAWAALLDRYKRLIYSIPVKYGFSSQEATDIFQDVCVELIAELPRLREPRALPKWLVQVTSRKCAHVKHAAARQPSAALPADAVDNVVDSSDLTEHVMLEAEREQALRNAVTTLPPRCQQLIRALFFEASARPYRDIARELNLAAGSIGFIRGRCLIKLRTELHKNGFK